MRRLSSWTILRWCCGLGRLEGGTMIELQASNSSLGPCVGLCATARSGLQPSHELPVLPLRRALRSLCVAGYTYAMHLPISPLALVVPSIRPAKLPFSMLLSILERTYILTTIGPHHAPSWTHGIVAPFTGVPTAILPSVGANTMHGILLELTLVFALVRPHEAALPMFLTLFKLARETGTVGPVLLTTSVLKIVSPFTAVHSTAWICV
mmetsp:Transcript_59387/g.141572  ORF Transcript_59387/g.141572 Transcript_59387/m.141572 type:complete len:209 (-) Transcript_59387:318-944(-)